MALLFSSWLSELVLVLAGGLVVLYLWFSRRYTYWTRRGIPQVEPSFPFGNLRNNILGKQHFGIVIKDMYDQLKGHCFGGIYGITKPMFIARDPDLIRNIMVKDFSSFSDRGVFRDDRLISKNLFALTGHEWKRLRVKLTPTFTSGKLKMMFPTMDACGRELGELMEDSAQRGEVLDIKEIVARYTTDVIASVAFGIECHSQRNPDAEFRQWGRQLTTPSLWFSVVNIIRMFLPQVAKFLSLNDGRDEIFDYFFNMVNETVNYREKNNVSRKDFMELLIKLKNKGSIDDDNQSQDPADNWKLSIVDVAAQALVFFGAGFETSSTTMTFTLYELSQNPEVQLKLQEDIDSVLEKHGGNMNYESINEMSYLHKVVSETLRKYPPLPQHFRECNQDYKIPDSNVIIEKGTSVFIPVLALHRDPEHYLDPERFDPERFSDENIAARHPYVYIPFGEGPRICIGMRLGLLQTKVGLAHLLSKFSVHPTETTKSHIEFTPKFPILTSEEHIQLRLKKRT